MDNIEIRNEVVISMEFFGPDGWSREPVTQKLQVPGEIVGQIFPHQVDVYSLTALVDGKPVGHCNNNLWETFLNQLLKNLDALKNNEHPGVQKFIGLLTAVHEKELNELLPFLKKNVDFFQFDNIAHGCGLMVLSANSGKDIGTMLVSKSDTLLKDKGFRVKVVETLAISSDRSI